MYNGNDKNSVINKYVVDAHENRNKVINQLLIFCGFFIIALLGFMGYNFYLSEKAIQERSKLYLEQGENIDGTDYVYQNGGDVSSNNDDIVAINNGNGSLTAKSGGTTTITISKSDDDDDIEETKSNDTTKSKQNSSKNKKSTVDDDSNEAKIKEAYDNLKPGESVDVEVTVNEPVTGISLDKSNITVYVGETTSLNSSITPSTATNKEVTWSSTDTNIATVDNKGKITGKKSGSTTIYVTTKDGNKRASCKVTVINKVTYKSEIVLNKSSATINVGDKYTIVAGVNTNTGKSKTLTYKSSNTNVAVVDKNGVITGKTPGNATINIEAKSLGISKKFNVTVKSVEITGLTVSPSSITITQDETAKIVTTISPSNATNKSVTYKSNDPSVATVDSSGNVKAIKTGTTTIDVTSNNGKKATVSVKVKDKVIPVTKLTIGYPKNNLKIGDKKELKVTVYPENATDKKVAFRSSNDNIVSVDSSGNLTAKSAGKATITVTASSGLTEDIEITVDSNKVTSISLDKTSGSLNIGQTETLTATILPTNASNKNINWSSSDENIATVNNGIVTALKNGKATITATTSDGSNLKATYTLTVLDIKLKTIALSSTSINLNIGGEQTISVKSYTPSDATNISVEWSSSDTTIATVDENGKVKGIKEGKATITATAKDGSNVKASSTVKVSKIAVTEVVPSKGRVVVDKGSTVSVSATVKPTNASYQNVTYKIANTSIATVDSKGNIKGIKVGTTKLTATADGVSKSIYVYVTAVGDKVHFIDVEDYGHTNGDCILIESTSNGKKVYSMIDTGHSGETAKRVAQYLKDIGATTIDWLIITHFHGDHYGGTMGLIKNGITIKNIYIKKYIGADSNFSNTSYSTVEDFRKARLDNYNTFITNLKSKNVNITYINKDISTTLGNYTFKLYNTSNVYSKVKSICASTQNCNENSNSLITLGTVNGKNIYFAGDLDGFTSSLITKANGTDSSIRSDAIANWAKSILKKNNLSKVDVYKVGHHGISHNNPAEALNALKPTYAVITALKAYIKSNQKETINKLVNAGTKESNIFYSGEGNIILNITTKGTMTWQQQVTDGCSKLNGCN